VTRNAISIVDESIGKSTRSGLDASRYEPTVCEFAEAFGGGSECLPFWRPPLWPFSLIRLFEQEED
jgi:hypothetical protein